LSAVRLCPRFALRFSSRTDRLFSAAAAEQTRPKILESTEEYKFVERLIPPSQVPAPPPYSGPSPSGWQPPSATPPDLPYSIRRSRMHNIPVYSDITHGNRHMTLIRKVHGDIWALERDVRAFLQQATGKEFPTQVNEVTMTIKIKGQFQQEVKEWLQRKGF
ncbi:unnamed protein product, partial [Knipowitschia caucasica]